MKNIYSLVLLLIGLSVNAQTTFWSEDFDGNSGGGSNWGTLNESVGSQGAQANLWYVSDTENGESAGTCGTASGGNNTLHVGSSTAGDFGAAYDDSYTDPAGYFCIAWGICLDATTNKRSQSNNINTIGRSSLTLNFDYIENGHVTNDNCIVEYSINGGTTWATLNDPAKTTICGSGQGMWTAYTFSLPATCENIPNLRIAFKWENNADNIGTDPSFAVNDIEITYVPVAGPTTWTGATDDNWADAGNWTAGIPTACSQDVIIPMGLTNYPNLVGQTVGCKDLTLGLGASITIDIASTIEVCGNIASAGTISGAGKLLIDGTTDQTLTGIISIGTVELDKSGASNTFEVMASSILNITTALEMQAGVLKATAGNVVIVSTMAGTAYIDDFTAGNTGTFFTASNIAVQRYISNPGTAFHYITSPVSGFNLSGYSLPATSPDGTQVTPNVACDGLAVGSAYGQIFDYRENTLSTCELEGWHVRTTGIVNAAQGFAAILPDASTIFAQGNPTTGNVSTTGITRSGASMLYGWNLIGNPYPSAINWATVVASNTHIVGGTAHLYESTGYYDGTYQAANLITGGDIAHGQAFFVQVSSATQVDFTNAMRTTSDPAFKSGSANYDYLIDLKLEGANGADKTIIAFDENFTATDDYGFDANKRKSSDGKPTLYTNDWNTKQGINAITKLDNQVVVVPMGLRTDALGQYTISVNEFDNVPQRILVFLEDKETGVFTNLRINNSYTFDVSTEDNNERFNLHFVPETKFTLQEESCAGNDASLIFEDNNYTIDGNIVDWNYVITNINESYIVTDNTQMTGGEYLVDMTFGTYTVQEIFVIGSAEKTTANFEISDNEVYVNEEIQLNNLSSGTATYTWNLGDGNVLNIEHLTYYYNLAGTYEIELISTTADCEDSKTQTINVVNKTTAITKVDKDVLKVYTIDKEIIIEFKENTNSSIQVFDLIGKQIASTNSNNSSKVVIALNNAPTGYYLLKIKANSKTYTHKVIVR